MLKAFLIIIILLIPVNSYAQIKLSDIESLQLKEEFRQIVNDDSNDTQLARAIFKCLAASSLFKTDPTSNLSEASLVIVVKVLRFKYNLEKPNMPFINYVAQEIKKKYNLKGWLQYYEALKEQ